MGSIGTSGAWPLAGRDGLPAEMLYLRNAFPRARWNEPSVAEIARRWLAMHANFRDHQAHLGALVGQWRAGAVDERGLHGALIPALQSFLQHLDGHHRIESGHYFPAMRQVEPRIEAGVDLLDRDHDAIHVHLEALFQAGLAFHQGVAGNAPDARDRAARLAERLDIIAPALLRHLEDEEDIVVPLIVRHAGTFGG